MSNVMDMDNERWEEFLELLDKEMNRDDFTEACDSTTNKPNARRALVRMGLTSDEIVETFEFLESRGGYCDCEIFLNIDMPLSWFEEDEDEH